MNPLYLQFVKRIADDAARFAIPEGSAVAFAWLAGHWAWRNEVFQFSVEDYGLSVKPHSENKRPFLIHQAFADMWMLVQLEPTAYGMLVGLPMRSGETQFAGDIHVGGRDVRVRQHWRREEQRVEILHSRMKNRVWSPPVRSWLERLTPVENESGERHVLSGRS